jgi:hypothetical protein
MSGKVGTIWEPVAVDPPPRGASLRRVRSFLAPLVLGAFLATHARAELGVSKLRCEYLVDPIGIDEVQPRLSWVVASTERGEK